ncbi:BRO-N domain-containing protein [Levilactobacillus brevis]|uniref:BRO-N domain-containing protein n=1 Tax=Levilactobacillus brevis TaxID=1580 RepID=UPI0020CD9FEF|nr:BRO family protein [Levilactobacillus brevis]MCP9614775.1 BRO family protein [Levilactobacillus brevis]
MNQMTPFNFEGNQVRTVMIDDEPHFVGNDVAATLGYSQPAKAIREHVNEADKGVSKIDTPGGRQTVTVINESGVYDLIFDASRQGKNADIRRKATEFRHWVTNDVLPSIRKTGTYSTDNTLTAQRTKRLEIMEANKQTRKATALYDIAMEVSDEYAKQRMLNEAAMLITGHDMRFDDQDYSGYAAQYIGDMLGISKGLVGRIANQLKIKAPKGGSNKYGHWVIRHTTTGTYSQWLYTDKGATEVATELRARIEQTA